LADRFGAAWNEAGVAEIVDPLEEFSGKFGADALKRSIGPSNHGLMYAQRAGAVNVPSMSSMPLTHNVRGGGLGVAWRGVN
jgi:hypothetical protein